MKNDCLASGPSKSIQVFKKKANEAKTIVIYGPSCVGKTTIGLELSKQLNWRFLSTDIIRQQFSNTPHFTVQNNAEVLSAFLNQLRELHLQNESIVCEGFFFSSERKSRLANAVNNESVSFIFLTADIKLLKRRLVERNLQIASGENHHHSQLLSEAKFDEFYPNFQICNLTALTIKADDMSVPAVTKLIKEFIMSEYHV